MLSYSSVVSTSMIRSTSTLIIKDFYKEWFEFIAALKKQSHLYHLSAFGINAFPHPPLITILRFVHVFFSSSIKMFPSQFWIQEQGIVLVVEAERVILLPHERKLMYARYFLTESIFSPPPSNHQCSRSCSSRSHPRCVRPG